LSAFFQFLVREDHDVDREWNLDEFAIELGHLLWVGGSSGWVYEMFDKINA